MPITVRTAREQDLQEIAYLFAADGQFYEYTKSNRFNRQCAG